MNLKYLFKTGILMLSMSLIVSLENHENDDNEIILDFDLRKSIITNSAGEYQFVNDS